jgi:hypothetical protein
MNSLRLKAAVVSCALMMVSPIALHAAPVVEAAAAPSTCTTYEIELCTPPVFGVSFCGSVSVKIC